MTHHCCWAYHTFSLAVCPLLYCPLLGWSYFDMDHPLQKTLGIQFYMICKLACYPLLTNVCYWWLAKWLFTSAFSIMNRYSSFNFELITCYEISLLVVKKKWTGKNCGKIHKIPSVLRSGGLPICSIRSWTCQHQYLWQYQVVSINHYQAPFLIIM